MLSAISRLSERAFCYFAISVIMGGYVYIPLKLSGEDVGATHPLPGSQNLYYTVSQALIMAVLVVLCSVRWRQILLVAGQCQPLNIFVALAFVSALWSVDPTVTLRRAFSLLTVVTFAYYLVTRFSVRDIISMLAVTTTVAAIVSTFLALFVPIAGVMRGSGGDGEVLAGAWSGIFNHKNSLGMTAIVACLSNGWLFVHEPRGRIARAAAIALCVVVTIMTRSRTAQIGLLLVVPFALSLRLLRLNGLSRLWAAYLLAIGTIGSTILVSLTFGDVMVAIGKDPSMTGRVPLWTVLLKEIFARPVLGYGFGAFFVLDNQELLYVQRVVGWETPEAHQGYLDLALDLGFPGLLLGVWLLLNTITRGMRAFRQGDVPWASFVVLYSLVLAITNMLEATLLRPGDLDCMLLPCVYAALGTEAARRRMEPTGATARSRASRIRPSPHNPAEPIAPIT